MSEALAKGLLSRQRRLHFIGVGGAGMSGIAELSLRLGFAVSGCDQHLGPTTERLAALGVQIFQGHHPDHIADHLLITLLNILPITSRSVWTPW